MNTKINSMRAFFILTAATLVVSSCQKSDSLTANNDTASPTIAVAASLSSSARMAGGTTDSVYLVQPCGRGGRRDSVAQAALPASITGYLATNYAGYTFHKAFAVRNNAAANGYAVVIYFNDKPVGLLFDATGAFVRVLEQREKGDIDGPGFHHGGRFEHRDGQHRDSIALNALPAAITSYLTANYATDTLVKAFSNRDSSIVVISKNNGVFATVFAADGSFIKRVTLPAPGRDCTPVELSALPSTVAAYLAQTYPNYVFGKAFEVKGGGTLRGYVVIIDANNTRYAVAFDATGNYLGSKPIH